MSASKYRCSFQLSVKASWVCITVRFCVLCCNNNPEMDVYVEAAWINRLCWSHQAVDKKGSAHWSYCYLRLGNLTLEMMQESETLLGELLGVDEFGPRLRPITRRSGWNSDERSGCSWQADLYLWSLPAGWQARKWFLQVDKEEKKHYH